MKISNLSLKHKDINLLQGDRTSTDSKIDPATKGQLRKIFLTHKKENHKNISCPLWYSTVVAEAGFEPTTFGL